jgi:glycerophosphoryl diester phosphodiesterase
LIYLISFEMNQHKKSSKIDKSMPWIVAHRGAMVEAPENTKAAFDKAVAYPIDGIELDVQITSDGIPVIFHDKVLTKKSDGSGRISDYNYSKLSSFDWGAWFSDDYRGEKILTLEQVLIYYGFKTRLFIEIKSPPHPDLIQLYSVLPGKITKLIRQLIPADLIENIYILSFDQDLLKSAFEIDPGLNFVLNIERPVIQSGQLTLDMNRLCGFCLSISKITPEFIAWSHQYGKKVMTYSCNTPKSVRKAFDLHLDVIMTDTPAAVIDSFMANKKEY